MAGPGGQRDFLVLRIVLLAVFAGALISRFVNPVFLNDQGEMLVLSQSFQLVYDEQPPLYAWIAKGLLELTGRHVAALEAFKLIFAITGLYLCGVLAYRVSHSPAAALLSVAFAMSLPTMGEDALSEATHTVAMIAVSLASTLLIFRQMQQPRRFFWLVLGLVWALGLAFKHTMIMLAVAQIAALWVARVPARVELSKQAAIAALIMLALNAAFFIQLLSTSAAIDNGLNEFGMGESTFAFLRGLSDFLSSILAEAALLVLTGIYMAVRYKASIARWYGEMGQEERVLLWSGLIFLAIWAVSIIITNTSVVRDRWLAPGLVWLCPVWAAAMFRTLGDNGKRWAGRIAIVFIALILIARIVDLQASEEPRQAGWQDMASQISAAYPEPDILLSKHINDAGNLHLAMNVPVAVANGYLPPLEQLPQTVLVMWRDEGGVPPEITGLLRQASARWGELECGAMDTQDLTAGGAQTYRRYFMVCERG
ncbi:glycosyltransferase family 39 protein [Maricaulis sp.]|uniref:ArnT family glycosyltransferase n=1 Tax=Maricaulis sp. TaxID=1486257 RepID=UPI00261DBF1C|nr:glycosyltransferase family 39 protein [Maricaulis sp.]